MVDLVGRVDQADLGMERGRQGQLFRQLADLVDGDLGTRPGGTGLEAPFEPDEVRVRMPGMTEGMCR